MHEQIVETVTPDGYPLRYRSWQAGESDLLVVTLHGVLTHSGWFGALGDALMGRGIHVIGHDRRGSGLNGRDRGDVDSAQRLLDDLGTVVGPQRPRYRRIVFLGWCLGSIVAMRYLLRHPAMGEGLILMSPDIFECHVTDQVRKTFSHPRWDDRLTPRLTVPIPLEVYTDSAYRDSFVRVDSLKLADFTPRFLRAALALKEDLETHFRAFRKPSLLLLAGRDQIIDNARTVALYRSIGSVRPEVVTLDCNHGIMFEAQPALQHTVERFARSVPDRGPMTRARRPALVSSLRTFSVRLPLRLAFGHHLARRRESRPQILQVCLSDGTVGHGEALPRPYLTGETERSVRDVLNGPLATFVLGQPIEGLDSVAQLLGSPAAVAERERAPAAFCALELALLDAAGRLEGRSVMELLGGAKRQELAYDGAVIGFMPLAALRLVVPEIKRRRKTLVKVKVGLPDDEERLTIIRRGLGDEPAIVVDANGAWTAEQAVARIGRLAQHGLAAVEQPVAGEDLDGLVHVQRHAGVAVIADESISTAADARALLQRNACRVWNLRVGKCGGLLATLDLARLATANGVGCHLGVLVGESGILTAAGRLLATCSPTFAHLESTDGSLVRDDLLQTPLPPVIDNRVVAPGARPGLGIDVDAGRLEAAAG
jgi:L-alanine-DL-glutamate epimerase-like enolase superfamily enzyme/alpha-beta hydrolase superfamily lysophospholipase